MEIIICYTGGVARGNPGPAAIGVYVIDKANIVLHKLAQTIGNSTDNFAEYNAVMVGLQTLIALFGPATKTTIIEVRLVSELVKKQLNAECQITDPGLVPMFIEIHNMRVESFPHLTLTQVPPEQNKEIDLLVNGALDGIR